MGLSSKQSYSNAYFYPILIKTQKTRLFSPNKQMLHNFLSEESCKLNTYLQDQTGSHLNSALCIYVCFPFPTPTTVYSLWQPGKVQKNGNTGFTPADGST
jgi:hypothetical protein